MADKRQQIESMWLSLKNESLAGIERGISEFPSLAQSWRKLREKIETVQTSAIERGHDSNVYSSIFKDIQGLALDVQISQDFEVLRKRADQEMKRTLQQKSFERQLLFAKASQIIKEITLSHLPAWGYGESLLLTSIAAPLPKNWQMIQNYACFPIEIYEKAFYWRDKKRLDDEEFIFVTQFMIQQAKREKEIGRGMRSLLHFVLPVVADINLPTFRMLLDEDFNGEIPPLAHPVSRKKFWMGTMESRFIKAFGNFIDDIFFSIQDLSSIRHPVAREFFTAMGEFSMSQDFSWHHFLTYSLINRELANKPNGIISVLNTFLEAAEETGDGWYSSIFERLYEAAKEVDHGPELLLTSYEQLLRPIEGATDTIENNFARAWQEFRQEYTRLGEPENFVPEEVILPAIAAHLLPQNEVTGVRTSFHEEGSLYFSMSVKKADGKLKKLSFIADVLPNGRPELGIQALTLEESEENEETYRAVKERLFALCTTFLRILTETLRQKKNGIHHEHESVSQKSHFEQHSDRATSKKRRHDSSVKNDIQAVIPPELAESFQFKRLRPMMIFNLSDVRSLPSGVSPAYIQEKVDLYNDGALSLRKIVSASPNGLDRFRLKLGKLRVMCEMREDGKLYVIEVVPRKDAY